MMDDSGQRPLGRRIMIAVSAMLGASVVFVGAVMLLLSVLVDHVVTPHSTLPASVDTTEAAPSTPAGPRTGAPKTVSPISPTRLKTGDRS
jgi:hypothetical protein